MLRTLFGDLAPRRVDSPPGPAGLGGPARPPGAEGPPATPAAATDVVVDASPAAAMRTHFAGSRAELASATAMITLLDPSRLWAGEVMQALSAAANEPLERLALRERGTLRTLAVIERTRVPRHGAAPLQVYHADIRATGLEQEEIANALAEGSHLAAVVIGALQPHAVLALLRSLLAATRHPEWRCPWLVFILPPGSATLRQRILDQDWPPHVHTAAMSESLASASGVWNAVLTAWEAASASRAMPVRPRDPSPHNPSLPLVSPDAAPLHRDGVMRALGLVARTEGLLACGLVNLACGDLLASDNRGSQGGDSDGGVLARHAAAICAARQAHLAAEGGERDAPDELLVTAGGRQVLLRTVTQGDSLGLVAVIDRAQANLALLRFRLLEAEKHLI